MSSGPLSSKTLLKKWFFLNPPFPYWDKVSLPTTLLQFTDKAEINAVFKIWKMLFLGSYKYSAQKQSNTWIQNQSCIVRKCNHLKKPNVAYQYKKIHCSNGQIHSPKYQILYQRYPICSLLPKIPSKVPITLHSQRLKYQI